MKVGITLLAREKVSEYFNSGIQQNVIFLAEALRAAGFETHLVVQSRERLNSDRRTELGIHRHIRVTSLENLRREGFNVVIQMGLDIPTSTLLRLRDDGVTLISYNCGNEFFVVTESILYRTEAGRTPQAVELAAQGAQGVFNQIWAIPQMMNPCSKFWTTLYRSPCLEAPFVWSPTMIRSSRAESAHAYTRRDSLKRVAIMEPNISFMKHFLPALLVCENAYRQGAVIDRVWMTNIDNEIGKYKLNLDYINRLVKGLDLHRVRKALSIESRYNSLYFCSRHSDAVVSWQMENNLNYLYLDLAWTGWPIIHNGSLCPDVGYYYSGFDYEEGGRVLTEALATHDSDTEYLERNREAISQYLPTSTALQDRYRDMLQSAVASRAPAAQSDAAPAPAPGV